MGPSLRVYPVLPPFIPYNTVSFSDSPLLKTILRFVLTRTRTRTRTPTLTPTLTLQTILRFVLENIPEDIRESPTLPNTGFTDYFTDKPRTETLEQPTRRTLTEPLASPNALQALIFH